MDGKAKTDSIGVRDVDRAAIKDVLVEHNRFWVLKSAGCPERGVGNNIGELVRALREHALLADGSFDPRMHDRSEVDGGRLHVLDRILRAVCRRASEVTCVVELGHVDNVYSDLVRSVYAYEHFDSARRCVRVSIFSCALDEKAYRARSGYVEPWATESLEPDDGDAKPLQDDFVGSVVVLPRSGGILGRTLVDPRWILPCDSRVRLTDVPQTVRGKRLYAASFPWRQQDGEAMSCAETSILSISCYFSNEYRDYPVIMPSDILTSIDGSSDVRVVPSQGRTWKSAAGVLKQMGLRTRRYGRQSLVGATVIGEPNSLRRGLERIARVYVDSGLPVAVNVQPPDSEDTAGHWVVLLGLGGTEGRWADWDAARPFAERLRNGDETAAVMDACNLEIARPFVVSDDMLLPYTVARWPRVSAFGGMEPVELVVPTAQRMGMGCMTARKMAGEVLRSDGLGLLQMKDGALPPRIVMTQQLVGVRSYLRFRCATSDEHVVKVFEEGVFPRFAWLFELVDYSKWDRPQGKRVALGEILLDATGEGEVSPISRVVIARYPGYFYYHPTDGRSKEERGPSFGEFASFDRNLRYIKAVRPIDEGDAR